MGNAVKALGPGLVNGFGGSKSGAAEAQLDSTIATPPTPPPAAAPATLAQAAQATKAKAGPGVAGKAKAAGTIGDAGPQGLTAPIQTANLTLLGGTK